MTLSLVEQLIAEGKVCPEFSEGDDGEVIQHVCELGGLCVVALNGYPCPHEKSNTTKGYYKLGNMGNISLPVINEELLAD